MLFKSFAPSSGYNLETRLVGHQDAILCLAVSRDGNLLASGGFDGLRMWDLQRQVQATKPSQMRNPRDPITCVAWLTRKDDIQETLCGGTGLGYVILWRQRADATTEFDEVWSRRICGGHEIMHLTCETFDTNTRIVTATRNKGVQLWSLDSKYHLSNIFSVELPTTVPRTLCFHGGDIVVFGMYDGEIYTLRAKDGSIIGTQSTGKMIGGAAMDHTRTYFIIDNAITGYSLHRMDDGTCIRTYDMKPSRTYPKQVAFTEHGERIIGGGEDGKVFVFDKASGELKQTLQHSNRGRVQTITTYETENYYLIATASSSNEDDAKIMIWKKHIPSGNRLDGGNGRITIWLFLKTIIQVLIHVLAVGAIALLAFQVMNPHVNLINLRKDVWHHYGEFKSFEVEEAFRLLVQMQQIAARGESGVVTAEDASVRRAVETDKKLTVEITQRNDWDSLGHVDVPSRL